MKRIFSSFLIIILLSSAVVGSLSANSNFPEAFATTESLFCDDMTIDELIASGNYNIIDNRDGPSSTLKGTKSADLILAGNFGDKIKAGKGNDCVIGGAGNDNVRGAKGNDQIFGQDVNDKLIGDKGNDALSCGAGVDTANGAKGTDTATANCETITNATAPQIDPEVLKIIDEIKSAIDESQSISDLWNKA